MFQRLILNVSMLVFLGMNSVVAGEIVEWNKPEGQKRLVRAEAKADFFQLAGFFEAQTNRYYCGPTTLAIILNSLNLRQKGVELPLDPTLLDKADRNYGSADAILNRYTPNTVVVPKVKSKEYILGMPYVKGDKDSAVAGLYLEEFSAMAASFGLKSKAVHVENGYDSKELRELFVKNLGTVDDFIVINYQREVLGQPKGGHISPVVAYDKTSDSFLIMDVNPTRASWVWASAEDVFKSMNTLDGKVYRGFVLLKK